MHRYWVYILTNAYNGVLYIGVTNNLLRRVHEHREGFDDGFTKRYHVHKLVYAEEFSDVRDAIQREKQLKKGPRRKKVELINGQNPGWRDLSHDL